MRERFETKRAPDGFSSGNECVECATRAREAGECAWTRVVSDDRKDVCAQGFEHGGDFARRAPTVVQFEPWTPKQLRVYVRDYRDAGGHGHDAVK